MERFVRRPPEELYDLEADPFELVNLAEKAPFQAQREAMKSQLLEWMRREGDPYLPA
jgi:N-sulfoglucosamine sulfohydrolase